MSETDDGSRSEVRGFLNFEPRTPNFGSRLSRSSRASHVKGRITWDGVVSIDRAHMKSLEPVRHCLRDEAKEVRPDARPQARKNRRRIPWNTLRIFSGRERCRWLRIVRRSEKLGRLWE